MADIKAWPIICKFALPKGIMILSHRNHYFLNTWYLSLKSFIYTKMELLYNILYLTIHFKN